MSEVKNSQEIEDMSLNIGVVSTYTYDIESAFDKLTGHTDNCDNGKIRGTTKKEVKDLCGENWNEDAWKKMTKKSNYAKNKATNNFPFFDRNKRKWFWY